jgi:hypothetical protein
VATCCFPMSSVRSPFYPPRSLANKNLFRTFPGRISCVLLVECVALYSLSNDWDVTLGEIGGQQVSHFPHSSDNRRNPLTFT